MEASTTPRMSFTEKFSKKSVHVDSIKQDSSGADHTWATFILKTSEGFTQPGVERLNESISTYVWAILGAQSLYPHQNPRDRGSLQHPKTVYSERRGFHLVPSRPPKCNSPLRRCPAICAFRGQLCIRDRPVHGSERYAALRRQI